MSARPSALALPLLALAFATGGCSNSSTDETPVSITFNPLVWVGEWTGTWTNATSGATGNITLMVTFDEMTMTVDFEITGNIFGTLDPEEETFELAVGAGSADLISVRSDSFGTLTGSLDGFGVITVLGTDVPSSSESFELIGSVLADTITINSTIRGENGSVQTGYATLMKTP